MLSRRLTVTALPNLPRSSASVAMPPAAVSTWPTRVMPARAHDRHTAIDGRLGLRHSGSCRSPTPDSGGATVTPASRQAHSAAWKKGGICASIDLARRRMPRPGSQAAA